MRTCIIACLLSMLQVNVSQANALLEMVRNKEEIGGDPCTVVFFHLDPILMLQEVRPYYVIGRNGMIDKIIATLRALSKRYTCVVAVTDDAGVKQVPALVKLLHRFRSKEIVVFGNKPWSLGLKNIEVKITVMEQLKSGELHQHVQCPFKIVKLGENVWKNVSGFVNPYTDCPHPLKGAKVDVAWFPFTPFAELRGGVVSGSEVYLVEALAQHFQFSHEYKEEWPLLEVLKTGKLAGVVPMVMNGSAFFGIGQIPMFEYFHKVVDFAGIVHSNEVRICSPKPKPLKPYWNMIKPFSMVVWLASLWCVLLGIFFFVVLSILQGKGYAVHENKSSGLANNVFNLLQSILSPVTKPGKRSNTLFSVTWFIFMFFIPHFYLSDFRAYLMEVDFEKAVDSEDDVLLQGRDYYLPRGLDLAPLLKASPSKSQRLLYEQAVARQTMFIADNGRRPEAIDKKMLSTGGTALLIREAMLADYPETLRRFGENPFRLSKKVIYQFYSGIIVPKYHPWTPDVEKALGRLWDSGLTEYFLMKDMKLRYLLDIEKSDDQLPGPFKMEHMFGVFMILIIGLGGSMLAFVYEVFKLHCLRVIGIIVTQYQRIYNCCT